MTRLVALAQEPPLCQPNSKVLEGGRACEWAELGRLVGMPARRVERGQDATKGSRRDLGCRVLLHGQHRSEQPYPPASPIQPNLGRCPESLTYNYAVMQDEADLRKQQKLKISLPSTLTPTGESPEVRGQASLSLSLSHTFYVLCWLGKLASRCVKQKPQALGAFGGTKIFI